MNDDELTSLTDLVWQGTQRGQLEIAPLTGRLTVAQGERVQLMVLDRWRAHGERLAGWKVGLTSGASRDAFGPGIRPFGFILESRVLRSGARIDRNRIPNLGLENELCFRIGSPLMGSDITATQVRAALAGVAPGFEINQNRTGGHADPGTRAADNLSQWGIVVGQEIAPIPAGLDFESLVVELTCDGDPVASVAARGHIDDHFSSIAALVRELAKFDLGLEPGQQVITGAYTRVPVNRAGRYVGTFTGAGSVRVDVTDGGEP
jgi:2-keto-4-pentenoate hydratase